MLHVVNCCKCVCVSVPLLNVVDIKHVVSIDFDSSVGICVAVSFYLIHFLAFLTVSSSLCVCMCVCKCVQHKDFCSNLCENSVVLTSPSMMFNSVQSRHTSSFCAVFFLLFFTFIT